MTQPLRILHVISRLDGYGGARTLRHVAAQQVSAGRRATVAALAAEKTVANELRAAGVTVHVLGRRWRADPVALGQLAAWRRRSPVDLVHAWDADALLYARLTSRGEPLVAAWDAGRPTPGWMMSLARKTAELPPGVAAIGPSSRDRTSVLAELGLDPSARMIALASPLVREKELDEAIWCFELVRVLHPAARLIVLGDGPDRLRLERYAQLVSEPDCVQIPGFRANLTDLLPHADVFWQLDLAQSTPHALLEAMAAGVPVVASDVPAHRAVIIPGETGLLPAHRGRADIARATDQLLGDADRAQSMGQAAADVVRRQWPIENTIAACDAIYRSLSPRPVTGG